MKRFMSVFAFVAISSTLMYSQAVSDEKKGQISPSINKNAIEQYNEGTNYLRYNNLVKAEQYFKKAIKIDPKFYQAYDHLGLVYKRQKNYIKSEEIFKQSIAIESSNTVALQNLGLVLSLQNKDDEAIKIYESIQLIDQTNPESYFGVANVYFKLKKYPESIENMTKAADLYTAQQSKLVYDAYYMIAEANYELLKYDESYKYYNLAKEYYSKEERILNRIIELEVLIKK